MPTSEVKFTKFFTSQACFDFAAAQAPSHAAERPFKADSMCYRIVMRMANGEAMTSWKAQQYGSSGDRRLREVLDWLRSNNIVPSSNNMIGDSGARYLAWSLDTKDRETVRSMVEPTKILEKVA